MIKDRCPNCAGHIAFPPALRGRSISCPHCGLRTVLGTPPNVWRPAGTGAPEAAAPAAPVQPTARRRSRVLAGVVGAVFLAGFALGGWHWRRIAASKPAGPALEVLNYELQKKESGLTYVVGRVTNHTDGAFRSVRIELDLLGAGGNRITNLFDFKPELAPHSTWDVKTLVLENEAVSARLVGVTGEPQ